MKSRSHVRVRGLTTATLSASWFVLVLAALAVVSNFDVASPDPVFEILAIVSVWLLLVTIRTHMLGVWLTEDGIECVSWLRKRTYTWDVLARLLAEPYAGFMSKGARTGVLSEVAVVTTAGTTIPLPGVVGLSRRVMLETQRVSLVAAARKPA